MDKEKIPLEGYEYLGNIDINRLGEFVQIIEATKEENGVESKILFFQDKSDWVEKAICTGEILLEFDEDQFIISIKVLVGENYIDALPTDRIVRWVTGEFSVIPYSYFNNGKE